MSFFYLFFFTKKGGRGETLYLIKMITASSFFKLSYPEGQLGWVPSPPRSCGPPLGPSLSLSLSSPLTPPWLSELLLQQYPIITISPSWATASHYHAALLIFLSYQLANHKPLSLMARFGARRYSFCRSNPAPRVLRITWRYVSLSFFWPPVFLSLPVVPPSHPTPRRGSMHFALASTFRDSLSFSWPLNSDMYPVCCQKEKKRKEKGFYSEVHQVNWSKFASTPVDFKITFTLGKSNFSLLSPTQKTFPPVLYCMNGNSMLNCGLNTTCHIIK